LRQNTLKVPTSTEANKSVYQLKSAEADRGLKQGGLVLDASPVHSRKISKSEAEQELLYILENEGSMLNLVKEEQELALRATEKSKMQKSEFPSAEDNCDSDQIQIVKLDENFRKEVALQLREDRFEQNSVSNSSRESVGISSSESTSAHLHHNSVKTNAVLSPSATQQKPVESVYSTVLSWFSGPTATETTPAASVLKGNHIANALPKQHVLSASTTFPPPLAPIVSKNVVVGYHNGNFRKLVMQGSDPYYWHSKAVTSVSAVVFVGDCTSVQDSKNAMRFKEVSVLIASVSKDAILKVSDWFLNTLLCT
jgi:hypothetical protein